MVRVRRLLAEFFLDIIVSLRRRVLCAINANTLWYVPGRVIQMGDVGDVAELLNVDYWRQGEWMNYDVKARLLNDLAHHFPDVDTVLFTSHRDQAKTGHGCSQELISLRTSSWNPFGCPEHPFLRRGNPPTPCTCRVADRVSCGGTGHYECTNDWINEHKIIC